MKLLSLLLGLPLLYSFTFNPMSQSLDVTEKQKSAQFLLENDSPEKLAIDLSVKNRIMDENGKENLTDTKEVTVFPPQLIIPPREKRTIRVSWHGTNEIKTEKAYRVIAEQLPLKVDDKTKKKSGIQMLMKYMAAFYVTPKDAQSELSVANAKIQNGQLEILIKNSGSKHQILSNPEITFKSEQEKLTLKSNDLKGLVGENILAFSERKFIVKTTLKKLPEATGSIKINE